MTSLSRKGDFISQTLPRHRLRWSTYWVPIQRREKRYERPIGREGWRCGHAAHPPTVGHYNMWEYCEKGTLQKEVRLAPQNSYPPMQGKCIRKKPGGELLVAAVKGGGVENVMLAPDVPLYRVAQEVTSQRHPAQRRCWSDAPLADWTETWLPCFGRFSEKVP